MAISQEDHEARTLSRRVPAPTLRGARTVCVIPAKAVGESRDPSCHQRDAAKMDPGFRRDDERGRWWARRGEREAAPFLPASPRLRVGWPCAHSQAPGTNPYVSSSAKGSSSRAGSKPTKVKVSRIAGGSGAVTAQ